MGSAGPVQFHGEKGDTGSMPHFHIHQASDDREKLWKSTGDKVVVPAQTPPKKATLPYDEGLSAARSPSSKRALCDGTEHLGYLSSPTTGFPKSH